MSSLSFYCALCGVVLDVDASMAGGHVECPHCRQSAPVPGPAPHRVDRVLKRNSEVLRIDVVFHCQGCRSELAVDGRREGQNFTCPICESTMRTPVWSRQLAAFEMPGFSYESATLTAEEIDFLSSDISLSPTE